MDKEQLQSADIHSSYAAQLAPIRLEKSKIGCIIALIFMPLGGLLDFIVYPELAMELTFIRIVGTISVAITYPLHLASFAERRIKLINLSYPMLLTISLCLMINTTDGLNGPYYAGLSMLVLAVSLLLPLTFWEAIIFVLFTILSYVVVGGYRNLDGLQLNLVFNNLYFLVTTGIIAITSSYFAEKARFREFSLTYELDQRNKQLAELDRIKSDFYANISHELRTPLTSILAPVEDALSDAAEDGKSKNRLGIIRNNAYRLLKLVNDLLDVLKLDEKKQSLNKQAVDVEKLLRNITSGLQPVADRKSMVIHQQFNVDHSTVSGDISALEKIFINLLNNAIKFTDAGGKVAVDVSVSDNKLVVTVTDNGVGIAMDQLPRVFDRFHQVDSSATRKHQGTGLGLALVKELTELHSGEIQVRSELGVGTSMTVRLPLIESNESELGQTASEADDRDGIEALHRTANFLASAGPVDSLEPQDLEKDMSQHTDANLLIVEDEPDIRNYLAESLSSAYHIDVASNGKTGLEKITANKPDLVVLDIMLPEVDGLEICRRVKENPDFSQMKVMLLTARTDEQSKLIALRNGADDFLTKPFSTVEIQTRLKNLLKNNRMQKEIAQKNAELSIALRDLKSAQSQLIQSEKLNAIGRLASGLMHEVNNPLNYAFSTFQLLEREPICKDDEGISEMMGVIRDGLERVAQIIKDLKTFAYPNQADTQNDFLLSAAVESAIRFTSRKAYDAEITSTFDGDIVVKGSQSHIVQILVNLLENALDELIAAEIVCKKIDIYVSEIANQDDRIMIHVRDNGPGISEENISNIFDPFFTTKTIGEGMGMGLSIATTIAKNHGGQLSVESALGEYTDFHFDLPKCNDKNHNFSSNQEGKTCVN